MFRTERNWGRVDLVSTHFVPRFELQLWGMKKGGKRKEKRVAKSGPLSSSLYRLSYSSLYVVLWFLLLLLPLRFSFSFFQQLFWRLTCCSSFPLSLRVAAHHCDQLFPCQVQSARWGGRERGILFDCDKYKRKGKGVEIERKRNGKVRNK